ncbi:azurin [bacterium]|nr:azurin [bacterium]
MNGASAAPFELKTDDHICIIGNTLGERMQHTGWLETLLVAKYPQHNLVFRNLAYSGDEITGYRDGNKRMRSRDFGTQDQWLSASAPCPQPDKLSSRDKEIGRVSENRFGLTNTKADVIFAFYGYGESWAGEAGLEQFKKDVADFIDHTLGQKYNGESAPRLVLFSPLPLIDMQDSSLPGQEYIATVNQQLQAYTAAMAEVTKAKDVTFVDLFTPNSGNVRPTPEWSINGLHLTEAGDKAVATQIMSALFPKEKIGSGKTSDQLEPLRKAINDKNWYWFHRYRTTDGYSTYGDRAFLKFTEGPGGYGDGLSNYSVMQKELEVLDVMTSNRDKVVWAAANGKTEKPVDDNLPEFLKVVTNKPGQLEGGAHLYLTGLEAIDKMTVHNGMKVELFADETQFPELVNPVQMAYDTKGRLWVSVWPTYPHWQPTKDMNDKLLILEDTNGDGKADTCKTFAGDIHNPTGFEFWNGGILLAQGPDLWFLKDTDGDDQYDEKTRLIHGLDTADTHHTANSFAMEPGGAVYFQEGTFHHSQIETPWGPTRRVANGAVFRYEPRSHKFDVYVSFGFANPHGHIFEKWGQDIVWDGTGAQPYHATLFSGDIDFPNKHGRPPQVYKQRTRPCPGTEVVSSSHFPEEMRGNLLVGNVIGFQGILQYKLTQNGASFGAEEVEPIVFSSDVNFRPSDIEIAPDGTIMFTEWQNTIIGHMQHNLRDPSRDKLHGRVYRVRMADKEPLQPVAIAGQPLPQLLSLLESPDDRVRHRARIELSNRPTGEVIPAAKAWMESLSTSAPEYEHHLLEGLWLYQSHDVVNVEHLERMLKSSDDRARAAATRVLIAWRDRVPEPLALLQEQVNDESPRARLQAIWGLSYFTGADAVKASEIVVESLLYDQDEFLKFELDETNKTLDRRTKAVK